MIRTEIIGDATLYLGDCRDVLPTLSGVDAVVTDPPYGIGKAAWDVAFPEWITDAAFSVADTVCIMPGLWELPRCVGSMGARYRSIIAGRNINGMTFGPIGICNWIPAVVGGKLPNRGQDCFEFAVGREEKPDHPAPKPLSFMVWIVDRTTDQGDVVLDPFMGSGTTGVACARLGRRFIGCEIEQRYFDIACRRIEEAQRQPDLFVPPPSDAAYDRGMRDLFREAAD